MACPSYDLGGVPAEMYTVARREDSPPYMYMYYAGGVAGWVDDLAAATVWPTRTWATAVARIFPGAVVIRVLIWDPLPVAEIADGAVGVEFSTDPDDDE